MKRIHRIILCASILLAALLLLGSCATSKCLPQVEYVRQDSIVTKYHTDSVRVIEKDSVFVKEKGDTIWLTRYKYIEREHVSNKVDTVYKDRNDNTVQTEIVEVVPRFYRGCTLLLWIIIFLTAGMCSWRLFKRYYLHT